MITQFLISWFVLQKKLDVFHWALYKLLEGSTKKYQVSIYPFSCFYVHRSVKSLSNLLKSIKVFHYVLNESKNKSKLRIYIQVICFLVLRLTQSRNKRCGAEVWSHRLTTFSFNCSLKVREIIHEIGFYSMSVVEF